MSSPLIKPPFYQSLLNPTHPLARNLILKWMMNEETGDGLFDITRNGNNGAVTGAVWGAGGLTLDGTNDLVTRARLTGLTNWTVHIKFTPEDITNIKNPIIDQGDILIKQHDDDIVYGVTSDLEIDYTSMVTACLAAGSPVDILVTRDGTTMVCYVYDINGVLYTDTFVVAGTANTSRTNLILGSQSRTAFLYPAMRPANMTGEKSLLINASDDVQYARGSRSLNSDVVSECWNANQKSVLIWIDPLNFKPGDGQTHYLFENQGTSTTTNREICRISSDGTLSYFVRDKDTTAHTVIADVTGWAIGERHQIFVTLDFAADAMALYVDGVLEDDAGHDLSNDSIDEIEATVHVGSGSSASHQVNIGMTIQVFNRIWSLAEITANYDSGDGTPFVVDPDTILSTIPYRDDDPGIVFHHSGMFATASNSAGDITDVTGCVTRFAVDDAVNFYGGCGEAITGPCIVLLSAGTRVRVHSGTAFAEISGGQKFYRSDADFLESGITGANNLTIQGWIFLPNIVGLKFLVTKWGAAGDRMYNFGILGDVLYFAVSDDGTNGYYNYSSSTIEVNRWAHVAIVYTAAAGTVDFYINGHFTNQGDTVDHSIADKTPPFTIGTWSGDTSNYTGGIFNIALFDDKRTAAEILASANDWDIDLSAEGNLIGNWMFDEAADAAAIDNTEGDAGRDLIPWDDGDVTFSGLRSVTGGYVQDVEKVGVAVDCDGTHYAEGGNILDVGANDFSASVWVNVDPIGTNRILEKWDGADGWFLGLTSSRQLYIHIELGGSAVSFLNTGVVLSPNRWHHIAITWDRDGNAVGYIDGVLAGVTLDISAQDGDISNANNFLVGSKADHSRILEGSVKDVKVYIGGLWSAAQIRNQAMRSGDYGTITESYAFTENTGTTINAGVTAPGNSLTLSSASAWSQEGFLTKDHLLTDENGGIGGVSNIDTTWTVTKDTDTKYTNSRSFKGVCAAGDDGDQFTLASPQLVNGENYRQRFRVRKTAMAANSQLFVDIDGAATPILSRQLAGVGDDGNWIGSVLDFDGSEYVDCGNDASLDMLANISFGGWLFLEASNTSYMLMRNNAGDTKRLYGIFITDDLDRIEYVYYSGGSTSVIWNNVNISDEMHHVFITVANTTAILYVDGISQGSKTLVGAFEADAAARLIIGARQTDAYHLNGRIAEIEILNITLTPADVLWLYQNPSPTLAGIIANTTAIDANIVLYHNYGTESLTDLSSAGNDGTHSGTGTYESEWALVEQCWKADQQAIEINMRAIGAGAGANALEVNVDAGQLRVNMVANGGCEGGADPPADWTQETNATVVSDTSPHSGTNCLKVTAVAANVGASQNITLVDGRSYTVTVYAKVTGGDTAALVVDTGDATVITLDSTTSTLWTMLRGTFVATGTSGVLYVRGVANGDIVWFDDGSMLINDYADAETDDRIRDFAGGRIDGLEIHNVTIPAAGIKRLRDLPHEMLL